MISGSRRVFKRFTGRHNFIFVRSQSTVLLITSGQSAVSKILNSRLRLRLRPETVTEEAVISKFKFLNIIKETD
jgi:hypothetical protein